MAEWLAQIEAALAQGSAPPGGLTAPSGATEEPLLLRLAQALGAGGLPPSFPDLAVLLRHWLRREAERHAGVSPHLRVARGPGWPDEVGWARYGLEATPDAAGGLLLQAQPWTPHWLPGADRFAPDGPPALPADRRPLALAPSDPFLRQLMPGMAEPRYLSRGQRTAARSVLEAPPASTLVVNLPTGSGKSLCGQVLFSPELAYGGERSVVAIVVPTTALCLDQAEAVKRLQGHDAAYHGGTDTPTRQEIRERIRAGTQGLFFTSPESLIGSLRGAVTAAARAGYLRAIVVDEAHIVEQWGDGFRSAFQQLAGLRRALLRECPDAPFRTLLLSATLTQSALETLESLFGDPGLFRVVSSVQLRPEPAYWFARCEREERRERVLEALRHLPRPAILYTTLVEEAEEWGRLLRREGYQRLAVMTGGTGGEERARIIRDWSDDRLDLVVATSAFGLGIDKGDVRAVIHACVPETLDRYYQEVGRGGRDGCASLSMVAYTHRDLKLAWEMNQQRTISVERGHRRWCRMFDYKRLVPEEEELSGRYLVDTEIAPGWEEDEIRKLGVRNAEWNVRTLTLMARAGLIDLDAELPPPRDAGGVTERQDPENPGRWALIRVRDQHHAEAQRWQEVVEPVRRRAAESRHGSLKLMERLLRGGECASRLLAEAYRAAVPSGTIPVARACGGCPACRAAQVKPHVDPSPVPTWPWPPRMEIGDRLAWYLAGRPAFGLFYEESASPRARLQELARVIESWLLRQGLRHVIAPESFLAELVRVEPRLQRRPVYFTPAEALPPSGREQPRVPALWLLPPGAELPSQLRWLLDPLSPGGGPALVVLLPEDTPDPERPDRFLMDVFHYPHCRLRELRAQEGL